MTSQCLIASLVLGCLFLGVAAVITGIWRQRHRAVRSSRRLHRRLGQFVEFLNDAVLVTDGEGIVQEVNASAVQLYGISADQWQGKNIDSLRLHPDRELLKRRLDRCRREGGFSYEDRHFGGEGSVRWVDISIRAGWFGGAELFGWVIRDETAMKLAELDLRLQARRTAALLEFPRVAEERDHADFMQWGADAAEELTSSRIAFIHFIHDDEQAIELVTWSTHTLESFCDAAYSSHYPLAEAGVWAEAVRERKPVVINDYESDTRRRGLPDGHAPLTRLVSLPVIAEGKVRLVMGVGNKVDPYDESDVETLQLIANEIWRLVDHRRAVKATAEAASFSRAIIDSLASHIAVLDAEGGILDVNEAWLRFAEANNMRDARSSGVNYLDVCAQATGDDSALSAEAAAGIRSVLRGEKATFSLLYPCHSPTQERWFMMRVTRFPDEDPPRVVVAHEDVTERRRHAQDSLHLAAVVEQAHDAIVITDTKGVIQYVNPAFLKVSGYAFSEVIGQNPRILKSGEQDEDVYRELWSQLGAGETWKGHLVNRRKDGALYEEDATITPVTDERGDTVGYLGVKRDVTKERRLSRATEEKQKLEVVGRLAGGIAHDFNNLLTAIIGFSEILLADKTGPSTERDDLQQILNAAERGRDLTRQLLAFSRQQPTERTVLDLNDLVERSLKVTRRIVGEDVEISADLDPDLWRIEGDVSQVDQVVLNLVVNARDAMPDGGVITIRTSREIFSHEDAVLQGEERDGSFVCLSVSDTGCGVSPEAMPHLFEPFFTTKPRGQGTGLGLATVQGIVAQSKGWIDVYSERGIGATFRVYLPALVGAEPVSSALAMDEPPRGNGECILVVEDESGPRILAEKLLGRHGYAVTTATTVAEAKSSLARDVASISLVFSDVVLPDGSGLDLADWIGEEYPEMPLLLTSGYADERAKWPRINELKIPFIHKPYASRDLLRRLHALLHPGDQATE